METSIDRGGLDGPVGKYNSMSPNGKKKKNQIRPLPHTTHTRKHTRQKAKELRVRKQDLKLWKENLGEYNLCAWVEEGF